MTVRWIAAEALAALAAHGMRAGSTFTGAQFAAWLPSTFEVQQRKNARARLIALGYIQKVGAAVAAHRSVGVYVVTPEGAAAAAAASAGHVRTSGSRQVPVGNFSRRLWALLRMHRVLDSTSAAETLCDAGGDFRQTQRTAAAYLRVWARAGVVQVSPRRAPVARVGGLGSKRYVLVADAATPPRPACRKKGGAK